MLARAIVVLGLAVAACGPKSTGGEDTGDATAGTAASSGGGAPTTAATDADSTGTSGAPVTDEQRCQARCDNADSLGCGSPGCVELCLANIINAESMGCGAQWRASVECEGTQALDYQCSEASACAAEYIQVDACYYGDCVHLGAARVTTSGGGTCSWGAALCYGHALAMECTATADAQCSCKVDKLEVATCALGRDLAPECDAELGAFTGCCTDVFVAALQP